MSRDEDSDLSDSLIDSFAEIKVSGDSPQSVDDRDAFVPVPQEPRNRSPAVSHPEVPQQRASMADSEFDSEFVRVEEEAPVEEHEESFQRQPPSRSALGNLFGLFGRASHPQSSPEIHIDENVKELQKKLVAMGFNVTTPHTAQLLRTFKTPEAVVKHLTETSQRRPVPQAMYPYGAH